MVQSSTALHCRSRLPCRAACRLQRSGSACLPAMLAWHDARIRLPHTAAGQEPSQPCWRWAACRPWPELQASHAARWRWAMRCARASAPAPQGRTSGQPLHTRPFGQCDKLQAACQRCRPRLPGRLMPCLTRPRRIDWRQSARFAAVGLTLHGCARPAASLLLAHGLPLHPSGLQCRCLRQGPAFPAALPALLLVGPTFSTPSAGWTRRLALQPPCSGCVGWSAPHRGLGHPGSGSHPGRCGRTRRRSAPRTRHERALPVASLAPECRRC